MGLHHIFRLLWIVSATCAGGLVCWFTAAVALHMTYSNGPLTRPWIVYAILAVSLAIGGIAGGLISSTYELPRRFSLRTLLITTTLLAVLLGLAVWAVKLR
jgi:hypothetical protein